MAEAFDTERSAQYENPRIEVAIIRARGIRAPYSDDFQVTPLSRFGEMIWREPQVNFSHGNWENNAFNFQRKIIVADKSIFQFSEQNAVLINSLKEIIVSLKYNRHLLTNGGRRKEFIKSAKLFRDANSMSILFANFANSGVTSLDELTPELVREIFSRLPNTENSHNNLISHFRDVATLSKAGMISRPLLRYDFKIASKIVPLDTSSRKGARTLEEEELAFTLEISIRYINRAEEIIERINATIQKRIRRRTLSRWLRSTMAMTEETPQITYKTAANFLRIAAFNIIAFHLGARISEVLSSHGRSIQMDTDGETLIAALSIFKGHVVTGTREYIVHPYMARIAAVLTSLNEVLGHSSEDLFFRKERSGAAQSVTNMNFALKKFIRVHGGDFDLSSHSFRYSLSDVTAGVLDRPFAILQRRLGHKFISEAMGYGMHGPTGDDLRKASKKASLNAMEKFLVAVGNEELGGLQGQRISAALNGGASVQDIHADLETLDIVPFELDDGKFCLKQSSARGKCSETTGHNMPEPEACGDECRYQVQKINRKEALREAINHLENFLDSDAPIMEKIRKTSELKNSLIAWPSLVSLLADKLRSRPDFEVWFS